MISIMRAIKPARKRIRIQPCHTVGGDPLPLPTTIGIREDNLWICVNDSQIPRTEEQYDSTVFIDKIWPGYYGWPTDGLEVNAPVNQQNHRDRTREEMSEIENMILERLTNEQYIASFIKFLSAEDFTHADFDSEIFLLLRGWFRHFRDSIVPLFIDHLKVLVKSHEEHQQRTAAEILTALIRGSKRWPYRKVSRLWQEITPLIQDALNSITGKLQNVEFLVGRQTAKATGLSKNSSPAGCTVAFFSIISCTFRAAQNNPCFYCSCVTVGLPRTR